MIVVSNVRHLAHCPPLCYGRDFVQFNISMFVMVLNCTKCSRCLFFSFSLHQLLEPVLTDFIILYTRKPSSKIVNFMSPKIGVLTVGQGQKSHIVLMHLTFKIIFFFNFDNTELKLTTYKE